MMVKKEANIKEAYTDIWIILKTGKTSQSDRGVMIIRSTSVYRFNDQWVNNINPKWKHLSDAS